MTSATERLEPTQDGPDLLTWPAWFMVDIMKGLVATLPSCAWGRRDAASPAVGRLPGRPWVVLDVESVAVRSPWNVGLSVALEGVHSAFSQAGVGWVGLGERPALGRARGRL